MGNVYPNMAQTPETIKARINEVYRAMLTVGNCGASEQLTVAEAKLDGRMSELRDELCEAEAAANCPHPGDAVKWNPYNSVVQCHACGVIFAPTERAWKV